MKGTKAKENLTKIIIDALGDSFIKVADKKIYAWSDDGGEQVQIALSMTMPKTPVGAGAPTTAGLVGSGSSINSEGTATSVSTELSPEDKEQVERLKEKLRAAGVYQE